MRTRSQGPEPQEDPLTDDSGSIPTISRGADGQKFKKREGRLLTVDVEEASTRTSFEAPSPVRDANLEVRRLNQLPEKDMTLDGKFPDRPKAPRHSSSDPALSRTRLSRRRACSPWSCSPLTVFVTLLAGLLACTIFYSFTTRQLDPKGCAMSYMRSAYASFPDFDTEHTRFATKYSLHLYRELGVDEDARVKGIPVLFIPGNAGSFRQVRPYAAEAAVHFQEVLQHDPEAIRNGKRTLDFFTVDFNEDITAFHGQTLLDQAEYLNEAIAYILSLYHNPHRSLRSSDLPDPTSVILFGHSMGGVVARTMLTLPNYQTNSVNTIITLAAPHARAPVSFDAEIVDTYRKINDFWRGAYTQKWANNNPLWHVTLISIAGGGLDTIVPSDYSTIASIVPPTHGFTVFSSSIPNVWTGMDHLAIMWCDQLRKSVVRALYDVTDAGRPSQTRRRLDRMTAFKRWFLTGLEDTAEKTIQRTDSKLLLTLEDNSNSILPQGERIVLRELGSLGKPIAHLLPIPPVDPQNRRRFNLLTDQALDAVGTSDQLDVLLCSVFPLQNGQSSQVFSINLNLSGNSVGSTRLACKSTALDTILLPASSHDAVQAFEGRPAFSYLQYDLERLQEYQFVAVVDRATEPRAGWVIAEFSSRADSDIRTDNGLVGLITFGLDLVIPFERPMMININIPSVQSSLLAYKIRIHQPASDDQGLFMPLLRQYITNPYESKFFVNVKEAEINMHGVAPYLPPPLIAPSEAKGLSLQIWSDSACNSSMTITLRVDFLGSMGKLWMRYRTVFAAFPLLVVAIVLRKQFRVHDETGLFMSFTESMDICLRNSIPLLFLGLTSLGMSLSTATEAFRRVSPPNGLLLRGGNATETVIDFTKNDLLLGNSDVFFWFLMPLFGLISVGICVLLNYVVLAVISMLAWIYALAVRSIRRPVTAFSVTPIRRRLITTGVLILLVWTVLPYQFLYIVLCFAQLATCVRALILARDNPTLASYDFYNYAHSILILMLWILPINMPTLVVWIHNLAVHWLTPFSSHHNVLSVLPFVLLVETLSTGKMVPRVHSWARHLTSVLFFTLAVYSAVYGITYAYLLHYVVNIICVWLMVVYFSSEPFSVSGFTRLLEVVDDGRHDLKKQP